MCNLILWQLFLSIVIPLFCLFLNKLFRAAISSFALGLRSQWSLGRYAHAYGICAYFYYISQQKKYEGEVYTREREWGITVLWISVGTPCDLRFWIPLKSFEIIVISLIFSIFSKVYLSMPTLLIGTRPPPPTPT